MKNLLIVLLTLVANLSLGQSETQAHKTVADRFVKHFNNSKYLSIFNMFSEDMAKALPKKNTIDFLSGLKTQSGNITHHEFTKFVNGTYASYKTTFDKATFLLNISIDDKARINGLFLKPYVEKDLTSTVVNSLSTNSSQLTKKQTDLIFNYASGFPNQTQLAIAVIREGKVTYYGIKRDLDTFSTIKNHLTVFEIGSLTKVFTTTLLAGFVTDGKIGLDSSINTYLDLPLKDNTTLTFKELANHTSGLPRLPLNLDLTKADPNNPYKEYLEADLEEYLTNHLDRPKNQKNSYLYSNLGTGLLGYTLAKIDGVEFDSLLTRDIFLKYNMSESTTQLNNVNADKVQGLDASGNTVSNWEFSVLAGAGGIFSNVKDLSKFALAQFDSTNTALKLTQQQTFKVNNQMSIGLGWHLIQSKSGSEWLWHNGGTGGYSSSMTLDLANKSGVIILSNVSAFNPKMGNIDKLGFELLQALITQ